MFFFKPQTKDDILQLMAKKMKHFARFNEISEEKAISLLAKAESSDEAKECKETDFLKFNDHVFTIAQRMLEKEWLNERPVGISPPPSSPI